MSAPAIIALPASPGTYGQAAVPIPADIMMTPTEGQLAIPLNIDWSGASGDVANSATRINLSNRQLRNFSSIRALYVDNSQSGADVTFIFPATQFQFIVPAGTGGVFPVVSLPGSLDFYAVSGSAIAGDKTFCQALNYLPLPVDISRPAFQTAAAVGGISLISTGSAQIVPLGVNGTLQSLSVQISGLVQAAGGGSSGSISIQDGTGAGINLCSWNVAASGYIQPSLLADLSNISVRFQNGIVCNVSVAGTAPTSGTAAVNGYYRKP